MSSILAGRSIDLDTSETCRAEVGEIMTEDQSSNETFEDAVRKMQSTDQGSAIHSNIHRTMLINQLYIIASEDMNGLLFHLIPSFLKSLADVQCTTELQIELWKLENGGDWGELEKFTYLYQGCH